MAALELTTRIVYFIQVRIQANNKFSISYLSIHFQITAETAYDMLSPGPSIRMKRLAKRKGRRKRYNQPQDIREGLMNACVVVKEVLYARSSPATNFSYLFFFYQGIGETVDNIVQVAVLEKEQKGISGAVGAVIRQLPSTFVKPVLIASEVSTNMLEGMQSHLVPEARKEANEKWRSDL